MNLYLKQGKLDIGAKVFEGIATGINIDSDAANDNFGDLHCHPSSSIGHVNGYAAHSPEDFLALRNNMAKPVFIRFVASGTHIYAAIYRSGHSNLDAKQIANIGLGNSDRARDFFNKKCLVSEKDRNAAMLDMDTSQQQYFYEGGRLLGLGRRWKDFRSAVVKRSPEGETSDSILMTRDMVSRYGGINIFS